MTPLAKKIKVMQEFEEGKHIEITHADYKRVPSEDKEIEL